jgi:hypothetical protein
MSVLFTAFAMGTSVFDSMVEVHESKSLRRWAHIGRESCAALFVEVSHKLTTTLTILNHYATLPILLRGSRHYERGAGICMFQVFAHNPHACNMASSIRIYAVFVEEAILT